MKKLISSKERQILNYLVLAYNCFLKLERQHPNELTDFGNGIHQCQYLIGMRIARKVTPKIFPKK
jgi:hypothetical protein